MRIIVDSREQDPLKFDISGSVSTVTVQGLPFADYWGEWEPGSEAAGYNCEMPICFERKSLGDLFNTLTNGMARFKRELDRAKENNMKLILIVEGTLSEVVGGFRYSSVKGESILKTMFTLWVKYDVVPVFCPNREEMKRFMIETWSAVGRNFKPMKNVGEGSGVGAAGGVRLTGGLSNSPVGPPFPTEEAVCG